MLSEMSLREMDRYKMITLIFRIHIYVIYIKHSKRIIHEGNRNKGQEDWSMVESLPQIVGKFS